jgi:hypothetical protein
MFYAVKNKFKFFDALDMQIIKNCLFMESSNSACLKFSAKKKKKKNKPDAEF